MHEICSTCCGACKQIMFWEHQGSFTAKALKFLCFLAHAHTHTFGRMNNVRPFVYSRVQVCVCVRASLLKSRSHLFSLRCFFLGHSQILSGLYGLWANKWALLYWPHIDHSSVPHSLFALDDTDSLGAFTLMFHSKIWYLYFASVCHKS